MYKRHTDTHHNLICTIQPPNNGLIQGRSLPTRDDNTALDLAVVENSFLLVDKLMVGGVLPWTYTIL